MPKSPTNQINRPKHKALHNKQQPQTNTTITKQPKVQHQATNQTPTNKNSYQTNPTKPIR